MSISTDMIYVETWDQHKDQNIRDGEPRRLIHQKFKCILVPLFCYLKCGNCSLLRGDLLNWGRNKNCWGGSFKLRSGFSLGMIFKLRGGTIFCWQGIFWIKGRELPFVDRGSFELRGVALFFCWQGDLVNWGRDFFKKTLHDHHHGSSPCILEDLR